jgi:hypothetical protein
MPGTTIGDGSVIGANSLVQGTIPADELAVGSPAKVIRSAPDFPEVPSEEKKAAIVADMVTEFERYLVYEHYAVEVRGSTRSYRPTKGGGAQRLIWRRTPEDALVATRGDTVLTESRWANARRVSFARAACTGSISRGAVAARRIAAHRGAGDVHRALRDPAAARRLIVGVAVAIRPGERDDPGAISSTVRQSRTTTAARRLRRCVATPSCGASSTIAPSAAPMPAGAGVEQPVEVRERVQRDACRRDRAMRRAARAVMIQNATPYASQRCGGHARARRSAACRARGCELAARDARREGDESRRDDAASTRVAARPERR